jgi:hypothetical protein
MSAIQKVVGKDPIAQKVLKVDPLAREIAMDHGLVAQGQAQAAAQPQAQPRPDMPTRNDAGWQTQRVAALRSRFAKPGWASAMPAAQQPAASTTAQPVTPAPAVSATPPAVPQAPAQQVTSSGTSKAWPERFMRMRDRAPMGARQSMPAPGTARIAIRSMPANPAADDVAAYSRAWKAQP